MTGRATKPKRGRAKAYDLSDALGQAAWAEADRALAGALSEFETLARACAKLTAGACTKGARDVNGAVALAGQALAATARKRGLQPIGAIGAVEPYDPALHAYEGAGRSPKQVKVAALGYRRGADVLAKARVGAARVRRAAK